MTWSERFATHVAKHDLQRDDIASALDVSRTTVHYWLHGATPRKKLRDRVEKWSKGAVPANLSTYVATGRPTRSPSTPPHKAA